MFGKTLLLRRQKKGAYVLQWRLENRKKKLVEKRLSLTCILKDSFAFRLLLQLCVIKQ